MATAIGTAMYHARQRREAAAEVGKFDALVASPTDLGTAAQGASLDPLTLPGSRVIAVRLDAQHAATDVTADTLDGRNIASAGGGAGVAAPLSYLEQDQQITINRGNSCPAGNLEVLVLDEWARPRVIATGVFS